MTRNVLGVVYLLGTSGIYGQVIQPILGVEGQRVNQQSLADFHSTQRSSKEATKQVAVFVGDTVIPHIVDGGSWSTSVTLTNLDTKTLTAEVLFFATMEQICCCRWWGRVLFEV